MGMASAATKEWTYEMLESLPERPEILTDIIEWRPSIEYPGLQIDLPAFFAKIHGER